MNEQMEKYISELSPELQEKARLCKTTDELRDYIADNDIELPEDALEMIAGGNGTGCGDGPACPKCGSRNTVWVTFACGYQCNDCLHKWSPR